MCSLITFHKRTFYWFEIKREKKPKGQLRMDNPDKLATLGTQNTGRRQENKTHNTISLLNKMQCVPRLPFIKEHIIDLMLC